MARGIGWQLSGLAVAALVAAAAPAAAQRSTTEETKQEAQKAGQKTEQAAERAEQKIDRQADQTGEKLDQKADQTGQRVDRATESPVGQSGAAPAASPAGRTAERRTGASGTLSDAWLTAKTKLALLADEQVSGMAINVDTRGGVVTLKGDVQSEAEKQKAVRLAREVEGVKEVQDQLAVKPAGETQTARRDRSAAQSGTAPGAPAAGGGTQQQAGADDDRIAKDVRQAIQRQWRGGQLRLDGETLKGAQDTEIEVSVDDGIVTLEGKVPDVQDIVQAAEAARQVQGVRAVKTNVESGRPS